MLLQYYTSLLKSQPIEITAKIGHFIITKTKIIHYMYFYFLQMTFYLNFNFFFVVVQLKVRFGFEIITERLRMS